MASLRVLFLSELAKIREPYFLNMALLFLRAPRGKELEERPLGIQRMSLRETRFFLRVFFRDIH
jgi:hypothetical protein